MSWDGLLHEFGLREPFIDKTARRQVGKMSKTLKLFAELKSGTN